MISPQTPIDDSLPGKDLVFIMFQGRCEYYELRFRDMAMLCKSTGASVIGFNPKGFHSSTGKTTILQDIVDDGLAVTNYLLVNGYIPGEIIMLGNSLGAAVQQMVCQELEKQKTKGFRQINSNSFKSLSSVIAHRINMTFIESLLHAVQSYAGWEIKVDKSFYTTGPHRCYLSRLNDLTILPGAQYHDSIDYENDISKSPEDYKETNRWLCLYNKLKLQHKIDKDPHKLSLHHFIIKNHKNHSDQESKVTVYDFINRYITASNKYYL